MNKVTEEEWRFKADNFQKRIKERPYLVNLAWYKDIVSRVSIGSSVLDVGCGARYIETVLPPHVHYIGIDPYPRDTLTMAITAEGLNNKFWNFDTVFALASLDNVQDLSLAIRGIYNVARQNIVIVTGIGIEPDHLHTVKVTRKDLTDVMGEPIQEIELTPNVYLFEFVKK